VPLDRGPFTRARILPVLRSGQSIPPGRILTD
jgi:hypothetical protein